jgi:polyisoprenoid-binding protein YceI
MVALPVEKFTMNAKTIVVSGPSGSDAGKNAKLTGHLQSGDFFDTEKYPDATFEITSVKPFSGTVTEEDDPPPGRS